MSHEEEDTCHMRRRIHEAFSPYSTSQVSGCCLLKVSKTLYAVTDMHTADGSSGPRPSSK
jgi:hypothetical protein